MGSTLDVEVCITRRKTFGLLHLNITVPSNTGSAHFVPGAAPFSLPPVFIASGLLAPVEVYVLDAPT